MTDKMKTQELINNLRTIIRDAIKSKELTGCNLLLLKDNEELLYLEEGLADKENNIAISRDTLFQLFSMTKPITATATIMLMEAGVIDLFDPVHKFLPGFRKQQVATSDGLKPVNHDMTIRELLNMTSGLVYPSDTVSGKGTGAILNEIVDRQSTDNPMSTYEAMNALGKVPLSFQPGDSWDYGTSADVLGAVVEVASGMSFGDFLRTKLFEPLGMKDTSFYIDKNQKDRLAKVYKAGSLNLYTGNNLAIINDKTTIPSFESGGAGLVSTIDDYAKFASMLLNKGTYKSTALLKPATVDFLTSSTLDAMQQKNYRNWHTLHGHSYGNLMRVVTDNHQTGLITYNGEYGWDGWLGCYFVNIPTHHITFLMMMQRTDAGTTPLARKLRNVILTNC